MITCKICGYTSQCRLIEHILSKHKDITIDYYKKNYGEVITEEYKNKCIQRAKDNWKNDKYRENVIKSREFIYNDEKIQSKRIKSIKKYYSDGNNVWNKDLTKSNDDRVKNSGIKIKNKLLGRTKDEYEYLKIHSDFMKNLWNDSEILKKWKEIQSDEKLKKDWIDKISETISTKISNGEINTKNNFKTGYYINNIDNYWFSSFLEKEAMILFDKYNLTWTTKHKIKIEYYINNKKHYYIPDFFIIINNIEYIIEMKGYDWDGYTEIKKEETLKLFKNYHVFYSCDNLELFIKEKII